MLSFFKHFQGMDAFIIILCFATWHKKDHSENRPVILRNENQNIRFIPLVFRENVVEHLNMSASHT